MDYKIVRKDNEIDDVLNACDEQQESGGTRWPDQTYEQGVAATIQWLTGGDNKNPLFA